VELPSCLTSNALPVTGALLQAARGTFPAVACVVAYQRETFLRHSDELRCAWHRRQDPRALVYSEVAWARARAKAGHDRCGPRRSALRPTDKCAPGCSWFTPLTRIPATSISAKARYLYSRVKGHSLSVLAPFSKEAELKHKFWSPGFSKTACPAGAASVRPARMHDTVHSELELGREAGRNAWACACPLSSNSRRSCLPAHELLEATRKRL
jgi:hypothetical protein